MSIVRSTTSKIKMLIKLSQGVLYVNRYDWSYHFDGQAVNKSHPSEYKDFVKFAIGPKEAYEAGYMMVLDAEEFSPDLVDKVSRDYEPSQMQEIFSPIRNTLSNNIQERIFMKPTGKQTMEGFGTFVSMEDTEYEFGWLVFADKKHDDFPEADELVAIIYDGVYDLLEGYNFAVEPGPDMETSTNTKESEDIQAAIEKNDVDLVKSLLERNLETGVSCFGDPLHLAVWIGNAEIVRMLLERCPPTEKEIYDNALHLAAHGGYEDILDILLDNGADVNASNSLQAAAWAGNAKIVKRLCERNADVNIEGGRFGHAVIAAVSGRNKDVTELLLENRVNVNAAGGQYGHALQTAALLGDNQVLEILLDNGADMNAVGGQYGTALQAAAYRGNKETVETLLRRGAKIDGEGNGEYESALFAAVIAEHKEIVEILLSNGADLNAEHKKRKGALHAAMEQWSTEIVETVLAWGADINAKCGPFTNGLQAAIKMNQPLFVEMFIDRGARVQGDIWTGNGAIIRVLLDKGILVRQHVD
ncbi:uncharacterized protein N7446_003460 [Penicillium canescens]|uniref:uncharacterized protein n=1 Tax=Penicillium canescens TaxID=5083 RepID=UPI0026E07A2B|nr:uncharacterized protein N7446_003460 [Penicillium canescens]KAJ6075683.1 hypothetical protein N7446_003460 [Penicillium canescens]